MGAARVPVTSSIAGAMEGQGSQHAHAEAAPANNEDMYSDEDDEFDPGLLEAGWSSEDSDKFLEVGEAGATEVVYVREGVAVWPTKEQRILGRLSLVKQHCVLFLAWLPYSHPTGVSGAAGGVRGAVGNGVAAAAAGSASWSAGVGQVAAAAAAGPNCSSSSRDRRCSEGAAGVGRNSCSTSSRSPCSEGRSVGRSIVNDPQAASRVAGEQQQQQEGLQPSARWYGSGGGGAGQGVEMQDMAGNGISTSSSNRCCSCDGSACNTSSSSCQRCGHHVNQQQQQQVVSPSQVAATSSTSSKTSPKSQPSSPPPAAGEAAAAAAGGGAAQLTQLDGPAPLPHSWPHAADPSMYAIHPVPLSDVKAIRKHTPALGWHYMVVVLVSGLTLPPLYFHQGGVRELLRVLKQHTCLVKSSVDPNTYLVNDIADPLQRSLTSLELSDILLGAPAPGSCFTPPPEGPAVQQFMSQHGGWMEQIGQFGQLGQPLAGNGGLDPWVWKDFGQQLGETLSRVGNFARESASVLVSAAVESWQQEVAGPNEQQQGRSDWAGGDTEAMGQQQQQLAGDVGVLTNMQQQQQQQERTAESGQLTGAAYSSGTGSSSREDTDGTSSSSRGGAAAPGINSNALNSTSSSSGSGVEGAAAAAAAGVAVTSLGAFELVDEVSEDEFAVTRHRVRPPCLGPEEFHTYFNAEGVLVDEVAFRERVFYSGEGGGSEEEKCFLCRGSSCEGGCLTQAKLMGIGPVMQPPFAKGTSLTLFFMLLCHS